MNSYVLDASALLALIQNEPGAAEVSRQLPGAAMSTVNLSESLARLRARGLNTQDAWARVARLELMLVPFGTEQARLAADLFPLTRSAGASFGDRACLALAQERGLPVLTADRAWAALDLGIEIQVIR
ncbi:MAG: PIN domain-containing protein [Acidobacteria bacterium]|nr:MAG: PIN domain-containing protein [Acidobacteriota bacterium]